MTEGQDVSISLHNLQENFRGVEALAKDLNSDTRNGIDGSQRDIARRIQLFGDNKNRPRKIKTLWELVAENFEDFILQVLCVAAFVTLGIGIWKDGLSHGWIDGTSIVVAIIIITAVTAGNNYVKEKQF